MLYATLQSSAGRIKLFFRTYHLEDSLQERFLSLIRRNISLRAVTVRIYNDHAFLFNCLAALSSSCPDLKSLVLTAPDGYNHQTNQLLMQICVRLEHFRIYDGDAPPLQDSDVLGSCAKITDFAICGSLFGPSAFESLIRHFPHLTLLDLKRCNGVTSSMSLRILTSCHLLTEFCAGGSLAAQDILGVGTQDDQGEEKLEPQDWVCLSLKRLSISISGLRNRPPQWQSLILGQIARLHDLRDLSIGPKRGDFREEDHVAAMELDEDDGIQLRLEAGLAILSGLKCLEVIGFLGLRENMDEDDVHWMLDAWPNLVGIVGKVHFQKHEELVEFLEDRDNLCTVFGIK
ncbi:hypothetical protein BG000_005537 [Podila horticola]|nr:hypothetical protein BG000_005537 [Podila horticola]